MAQPKTTQVNLEALAKDIRQMGLRNWLIKEFTLSFKEARKHKRHTFNEHSYDTNWTENIIHLVDAVLEHYYKPSASIAFVIFEPMIREIFAAPFADRIIHHFLYRMQYGWWDRRFIQDSYSCREGKGTLYGVQRIQRMMRQATENYTKVAYIIKLDIRGYFMSLPRYLILARVRWGLKRQFNPYFHIPEVVELYKICDFLWKQVLLDDPAVKARRRGKLSDWKYLPPEKSLFSQLVNIGIVIGNLTSQLVSNIYLDQLDRFIKYTLGYKYYGRYVDDFIIIVTEDQYEQAKKDIKKIEEFLKGLGLILHKKKRYCNSVYKGVSFLGARIYPHCLYPSNRLQQHFLHMLYKMKHGEVSNDTIISYFGFFANLNAKNFIKKSFTKFNIGYDLYEEIAQRKKGDKEHKPRSWDDIIYDMRCDIHGRPRPTHKK